MPTRPHPRATSLFCCLYSHAVICHSFNYVCISPITPASYLHACTNALKATVPTCWKCKQACEWCRLSSEGDSESDGGFKSASVTLTRRLNGKLPGFVFPVYAWLYRDRREWGGRPRCNRRLGPRWELSKRQLLAEVTLLFVSLTPLHQQIGIQFIFFFLFDSCYCSTYNFPYANYTSPLIQCRCLSGVVTTAPRSSPAW